jgi:hypothetical protein
MENTSICLRQRIARRQSVDFDQVDPPIGGRRPFGIARI